MFFRNKKGKYTDVEGYNRISRLIEDRQREMSDHGEPEDDFDDESVLLTREPIPRERSGLRVPDDAPTVSAVRPAPRPSSDEGTASTNSTPAGAADERRIPFQPAPAVETQAQPAPVAQAAPQAPPSFAAPTPPPMVVPELGQASMTGCLIAAEATWEGRLATSGNVRVEGTMHGELETSATLYVAAKARIDGTIRARSIMLAGEIEGQVMCGDRLEILPGGSARGEIETATLVVHEGAYIDSRFQMRRAEAPALG